ncbi:hypothetical protein F5050DRAFT_1716599, partial [Lentinula boryana]
SLSTWNKFLKSKYLEVLKSRLSNNDLNDPKARSRAMKPEVDWYCDYVDSYFVAAKDTGHVRTSVKRIMRPLVNLAKKINDTSGYHILSFVITTATDRFGDEVARLAKEAFESKIVDQIRDLEAYVQLTEINNCNVSMELSTLVAKFSRNIVNGRLEEKKDWEKRLLCLIFEYDLKVCLGEDLPSSTKLNFNNFLAKAWMFKDLSFPRKFELEREYNNLTKRMDDEDLAPTHKGVPFKLERWSDDEHALAEEDMGDIALVVGINNQTLVSVSDVQSWQAAVGDSEDETAAYNEQLKKALARRPPPPPQAHHPPAPSLPSQVEVLSRHPLYLPHILIPLSLLGVYLHLLFTFNVPLLLILILIPSLVLILILIPSLILILVLPPKESAGLKCKQDEGTVDDEKGTDGLATRKKHDARVEFAQVDPEPEWADPEAGSIQEWADLEAGSIQGWADPEAGSIQEWADPEAGSIQGWADPEAGSIQMPHTYTHLWLMTKVMMTNRSSYALCIFEMSDGPDGPDRLQALLSLQLDFYNT